MGWLILLAMFLITAFVTYGVFANIVDARREQDRLLQAEPAPVVPGQGRLSEKLVAQLRAIAESGDSAEAWLQRTRVPYGHCTSAQDCDKTTRCVQCRFFETTEEDVPALRSLLDQEMELAELSEERDMIRGAEIHRSIAAAIQGHLKQFETAAEAS